MKMAHLPLALAVLIAASTVPLPTIRAQQDGATAAPDAAIDSTDANTAPLREQSVYIPYTKLREVFEKQGRGVFLPYEKFQELWKQAREKETPVRDERPPVGIILTEIESDATIEKDVVTVTAKLKLEVLGEGWHEAPLRLSDAAIRSATIGNETARIIFDSRQGYRLLVKNEDKQPRPLELSLVYTKAFSKAPGQNSVSFQAPQAPVNRWRIRIPQPGAKVSIHPMIAATEAPAGSAGGPDGGEDEDEPTETVVLAFVGAAPAVRVDWTPKAEGATGLAALATVQSEQEVTVAEGVVRTRARLLYEISRAELAQLQVQVPTDQKVTGVFDPNVRQWEVAVDGGAQTITVHLFQATRGSQSVTVELEKFIDEEAMRDLQVPVLEAVGVGRQQGLVVVRVEGELRAEAARRTGLLQLDASELPPTLRQANWSFAYRYAALPFELALSVEKVQPQIRVHELVEAFLEPQQVTLDFLAVLDIQRAGVFQVEIDVPAGYEVRSVRGHAASGAEAAAIDTYHLEDNDRRLRVNLARKALGKIGLLVELHRTLDDANLLSPTGESSAIVLPLARVATPTEHSAGRLVVQAPESLRLALSRQSGLRTISFTEAYQDSQTLRGNRFGSLRPVLAFAYTPEPIDLALDVQRRRPQVTVRQLLTAHIESGVVRYAANFYYDVLYSGVKSLRIDVPVDLASEIRHVTAGVREQTLDPQPANVAEGYVAWSFTGETEFLGATQLQLKWELQSEELEIGRSIDFPLPVLKPTEVDRSWGQVVIAKAETLDVRAGEDLVGLRPIDPQQDLMQGVQVADAARAFEFHSDWSLSVTATRYELEDVKRTSIERALLRMVVTRSDRISVQALYRMRSAVQRLAIKLPATAEFDTDPLRINGQPKALEHGQDDALFIPLVDQSAEDPFLVELRYTVPGNQTRLDFPVFPEQIPVQSEPAVQKVHLAIYLPDEMALLSARGPWTNQQDDWYRRLNAWPGAKGDNELLNWVSEGVTVANTEFRNFATDGRLYAFTTLRPPPPPDGSLRLVAMPEHWLNALVFGSLALVGLVCVRQPLANKLSALALLIICLVLLGVFAPTLAMQVIDANLLLAIALVAFVWLVATAVSLLPRSRAGATVMAAMRTPLPDAEVAAVQASSGDSPFGSDTDPRSTDTHSASEEGTPADSPSDEEAEGGRTDA